MAGLVGGRRRKDPKRIEFKVTGKSFSGINRFNNHNSNNAFKIFTSNSKCDASYSSSSNGVNGNSLLEVQVTTMMNKKSDMWDQNLGLRFSIREIGAGLQNLGNSCFLNSVLQCLTYTEPLAEYLLSGKHQSSCNVAGFCALCAIQKHVSRALQSTGRILAPKELVSNLRCISRNFRNSRQEDAHEYMVNLLDSMHKCCLPPGVPSESPIAYEKSLVYKIFGGRLRSQVKCMQCSYCSNKYDPFIDLSLELAKADSLHKALLHFTSAEELDGGERQYQCQRCKQKVRALKQLTIYEAPNILTVHLKRFHAHDPGQKIDRKIRFGPTLDLRPYVSGSHVGDLNYTLYGVLVHAGWSTRSGHYYCFARTSTGLWYSLDDNRVVQVSERTVLEQKAYMLYYCRDRKTVAPNKPSRDFTESKPVNAIQSNTSTGSLQGYEGVIQNALKRKQSAIADSSIITSKDVSGSGLKLESEAVEPSDLKIERLPGSAGITSVDKQMGTREDQMNIVNLKVVKSLPSSVLPPPSVGPEVVDSLPPSVLPAPNAGPEVVESLSPSVHPVSSIAEMVKFLAPSVLPVPSIGPKVVESLPPLVLSSPRIGEGPELDNDASLAKGVELSNEFKSSSTFVSCLVTEPHDSNGQPKHTVKPDAEKISPKLTDCLDIGSLGIASGVSSDQTSDMSLPSNSSDVKIVARALQSEVTKVLDSTHPKSSILRADLSPVVCRPHRKLGKTALMSSVSLRLGPRIMFSTLNLQEKKKNRRKNRFHRSKDRNLNIELMGDIGSEPSTSDKSRLFSLGSTPSRSKSGKSFPKAGSNDNSAKETKETNNSDDVLNAINGNSTERVSQSGAMLTTYKLLEKSCSMNPEHSDFGVSGAFKENHSTTVLDGLTRVPTKKIEETSASCCNGLVLSSQRFIDSINVDNVRIGYVGDQWDEEYDRGKRKKMRLANKSFHHSNVFQETATKKAQNNRMIGRSSSGSCPFRI